MRLSRLTALAPWYYIRLIPPVLVDQNYKEVLKSKTTGSGRIAPCRLQVTLQPTPKIRSAEKTTYSKPTDTGIEYVGFQNSQGSHLCTLHYMLTQYSHLCTHIQRPTARRSWTETQKIQPNVCICSLFFILILVSSRYNHSLDLKLLRLLHPPTSHTKIKTHTIKALRASQHERGRNENRPSQSQGAHLTVARGAAESYRSRKGPKCKFLTLLRGRVTTRWWWWWWW